MDLICASSTVRDTCTCFARPWLEVVNGLPLVSAETKPSVNYLEVARSRHGSTAQSSARSRRAHEASGWDEPAPCASKDLIESLGDDGFLVKHRQRGNRRSEQAVVGRWYSAPL